MRFRDTSTTMGANHLKILGEVGLTTQRKKRWGTLHLVTQIATQGYNQPPKIYAARPTCCMLRHVLSRRARVQRKAEGLLLRKNTKHINLKNLNVLACHSLQVHVSTPGSLWPLPGLSALRPNFFGCLVKVPDEVKLSKMW